MLVSLIIILVGVSVYFFVSRNRSPIPYFPSNKKDIKGIVQSLQLSNDQVVYDLGAGDGVVIFSAASVAKQKKYNTKFIAVEINPVLIGIMHLRRLLHPNRKNIQIVCADIFSMRYTLYLPAGRRGDIRYTMFAYISPWYLERVFANCKSQISPDSSKSRIPTSRRENFKFISYFYPVPKLKSSRTIKGAHNTYIYNV